ncbi:MAG: transporter related protein [Akkermansiaceae bacterium]|nr:transporter related protein [Akkermansiaceae bacterium]
MSALRVNTGEGREPSPASEPLLRVAGLEAVYGASIAALHHIDLTVRPGEIVALLGSNGAGKTTTLKAISNLLPAQRGKVSRGEIHFDGHDVLKKSPSALARLGLVQVLEGRHCFRTLSVEENLITGGLGRSSSRREIAEDLEKVYAIFPRLKEKRKSRAGLASGGEQQMTAIGRALMTRPRLLVLDEPSMGLAPLTVQAIFKALAELNESAGLAILVAEQNAAVALRFAHRVAVIENGTSVVNESAAEFRRRSDVQSFYLGGGATIASGEAGEVLLQQQQISNKSAHSTF